MELAYLLVSLLTPWLAGFSLLRAAEARATYHPHLLRQMAFGFFFGYSLLQLLVLSANAVLGTVPIFIINATLLLIAIGAYLLHRKTPSAVPATIGQAGLRLSQQKSWIFWFFLCLAVLHLSLAAIEVVHRPIFPWDAWLSWMYRAKAWFFAGSIVPMDSPQDWLHGKGTALYNVAGAHYPSLLPITAMWTALHIGHWSETLVNLPVVACGFALSGGVYGLCREAECSPRTSVVAAYLLLSIPLIGAHLSLAGQADIWMAGYAGLGVSACLLGLIRKMPGLLCLGLLLTALSIGVKAEGGVWLLVALGVGATTWLGASRRWAYLLPLPAIALVLWLAGIHFVELPLFGGVGISDGFLQASFLGSHELQRHDVLNDYWQNFFVGGTWNLLWPLLILTALATSLIENPRERVVIVAFLCIVVASQVIIFGFTSQGRWAEDWTAINRIPLHLAPAFVLCLVLIWSSWDQPAAMPSRKVIAAVGTTALLVSCTITIAYLGLRFGGENGERTAVKAANHRLVVGKGELRTGERSITRFDNNVAIVSSGPVNINTDSVSVVSLQTSGNNNNGQNFFWRTAEDPKNLKMLQYEGRGKTYLRLRDNPEWSGKITEIGLVFYDDGGTLAVGDITVQPDSLPSRVRQATTEWMQMMPWSQKSLNWLPAGAPKSFLPLPLFVLGWLVLALGLVLLGTHRSKTSKLQGTVAVCLVAWLVLDLRWLINQGVNTLDTVSSHTWGNTEPLRFGGDKNIRQTVTATTSRLPTDGKALLITADDHRMRYQMLRAKYHALPRAAYVHEGPRGSLPDINQADHLLVLKQPFRDPAAPPTKAAEWQAFLSDRNHNYRVLRESDEGFLLGPAQASIKNLQSGSRQ